MLDSLKQVGSTLYVQSEDIVKIYETPERPGGLVYVVTREQRGLMPSEIYHTSDWPMAKVRAALGLTDVTELDRMLTDPADDDSVGTAVDTLLAQLGDPSQFIENAGDDWEPIVRAVITILGVE